jgi:electron transfer flavoprotein alpha subunit
MAAILAVLEQRDGSLKKVSHEVLGAARKVGDALGVSVEAVAIGPASLGSGLDGLAADKCTLVADDSLQLYQADLYASAVASVAHSGEYRAVVFAATAMGKDLAPRVAARLKCPLVADVTGVGESDFTLVRPVYAGKAISTVKVTSALAVVSVRPNAFEAAGAGQATLETVALPDGGGKRVTTVEVKEPENKSLDVSEASIVVSGGRGLKDEDSFKIVDELAAAFGGGAAVGASRAVVDAGWRPHSEQVGQTGKVVSPDLYIAVGISGAIQHLAGMRTSKVIVAINRDKDAPIFSVADYGIVGDLFEVLPVLTEEIRKIKAG